MQHEWRERMHMASTACNNDAMHHQGKYSGRSRNHPRALPRALVMGARSLSTQACSLFRCAGVGGRRW